jgi:hypothetical protein
MRPSAMAVAAWQGSTTGRPSGGLERFAVARHTGAAEDQHVRAVGVAQGGADLDHTRLSGGRVGKLRTPRPRARSPASRSVTPMAPEGAQVPRDRGGQDRDHAEALAEGQRGHHRAFLDAEHGPGRPVAQGMQGGIAETGDDEARRLGFQPFGQRKQMRHHRVGLGLALDAGRTLGQRDAGIGVPSRAGARPQYRSRR